MTSPRRRFEHPATFTERLLWTVALAVLVGLVLACAIVMAGPAH